jgi:hypothetical protein
MRNEAGENSRLAPTTLLVICALVIGCRSPAMSMRSEPCSAPGVKADVSSLEHRPGGRKLGWLLRKIGVRTDSSQTTIRVCNGSARPIHVWTDSMIDGRPVRPLRSGACGDGSQVEVDPQKALVVTVEAAGAQPESFQIGWTECPFTGPSSCHLVWTE